MTPGRIALLAGAIVAVSWSAPLVRLADGAPPLAIAFWRTAIASLVLAPPVLLRRRAEMRSLDRKDVAAMLLAGGMLAAHFATWIASISLTTVASSALLVSTTPVFVAIAGYLFAERAGRWGWIGIAIAMVGAALVASADLDRLETSGRGNLLALLGAIAGAGYLTVGRRIRIRRSVLTYAFLVYFSCAAVLLAAALLTRTVLVGFSLETWLVILAIAAGPQLFAHTSLNYLLEKLEATKITVAILAEPLGATLIAFVLFDELPGPLAIPGAILVLIGIGLVLGRASRTKVGPGG